MNTFNHGIYLGRKPAMHLPHRAAAYAPQNGTVLMRDCERGNQYADIWTGKRTINSQTGCPMIIINSFEVHLVLKLSVSRNGCDREVEQAIKYSLFESS